MEPRPSGLLLSGTHACTPFRSASIRLRSMRLTHGKGCKVPNLLDFAHLDVRSSSHYGEDRIAYGEGRIWNQEPLRMKAPRRSRRGDVTKERPSSLRGAAS